jgi:hypothetical protein
MYNVCALINWFLKAVSGGVERNSKTTL